MLCRLLQGQARLVQRPLLPGSRRLRLRVDPLVSHHSGRHHQGAHPRKAHAPKRRRHTRLSNFFYHFFSLLFYRLSRFNFSAPRYIPRRATFLVLHQRVLFLSYIHTFRHLCIVRLFFIASGTYVRQ